jgi:hypothetical protein
MASPVFGRVEKPEQLNLDPFKFTLVGYRVLDDGSKEEVSFGFTASGVRPFYVQIDMVRAAASESNVLSAEAIAKYVEVSLLNDQERERFRDTLEMPDIFFEAEMLGEVANWLGDTYSSRPTKSPTARRSGQSRGGRRSTGAASAKASGRSASAQRG